MYPAFSIIFFTTASGAGYGMLFWMGLWNLCGVLPTSPIFLMVSFTLALTLVSAGLLASTFHLGNPQRAWRALSQWRTSWLSREGVMALVTYPITLAFAGLLLLGDHSGYLAGLLGLLTSFAASLTVYTTANIYASLKTIPQWHHTLVTPNYLLLGLGSGSVLLFTMVTLGQGVDDNLLVTTTVLLLVMLVMKRLYWRDIDRTPAQSSAETATGLGAIGTVRSLEHPHSQENWVMREMGFRIARNHARTLRMICLTCFMAALACTMLVGTIPENFMTPVFVLATVLLSTIAVVIERWLLFAEAKHVVMYYYS